MTISFVLDWASFALGVTTLIFVELIAVITVAVVQTRKQQRGVLGRRK